MPRHSRAGLAPPAPLLPAETPPSLDRGRPLSELIPKAQCPRPPLFSAQGQTDRRGRGPPAPAGCGEFPGFPRGRLCLTVSYILRRRTVRELLPVFLRLMSSDGNPTPMSYQDFCALAVSYMAQLYNAARRMTADPQEAEDLVQDTYQRAFQAYRQLKGPAQCRAWLYQIMRNLFID